MAFLPQVSPTIQDGALGITTASGTQSNLLVCAPAPALASALLNALLVFTDPQQALTTLGRGPAAQAVALDLASGVSPVYCICPPTSGGGTQGTITHAGASVGTVTQTGTANDYYEVVVQMASAAGVAGGVSFAYSLDGASHWSSVLTLAAATTAFVVPNAGFTLTFGGASFAVGDTYSWQTSAPSCTDADITTALTTAFAQSAIDFDIVHVVKQPVTAASEGYSTGAALGAVLGAAEGRYAYAMGLVDAGPDFQTPSVYAAAVATAFANFAVPRVMVCGGYERVVSPLDGNQYRRPVSWSTAARLASTPPAEHPGRIASGALKQVAGIYYDEDVSQLLDVQRVTSHRTLRGSQGYYVTRGRMMAPAGSDYSYVMARRVIDKGCKIARGALLRFLNSALSVNAITAPVNPGGINEVAARNIENWAQRALEDALVSTGQASAVSVSVSRTANIISTSILPVTILITPLGYAENIAYTIGFQNPALLLAA